MRLDCPPDRGVASLHRRLVPDGEAPQDAGGSDGGLFYHLWMRKSVALLVSILVHCLIVIVFGLIQLGGLPGPPSEGMEVQIGSLPGETLNMDSSEEQFDVDVAEPEPATLTELEATTPEIPFAASEQMDIDMPSLQSSGGGTLANSAGLLGQGGSGATGRASFMGVQAYGRRFCIIADCSGSMKGPPLRHLKEQVRLTMDTMTDGSAIHLVFYSNHWDSFPDAWGSPTAIRPDANRWLNSIEAGGGTNPAPAFRHAFAMKPPPDAIFFMTDGKIPDNVDEYVASENSARAKRIPIHTIAFLNRRAAEILKRIADESGGKFRYVRGF